MSMPPQTTHRLVQAAAQAWSDDAWMDVTVLVGVSGGADSVALLLALQELRLAAPHAKGRLVVAHFHHAVRASAEEDLKFVRQLAASHGLSFATGRRDADAPGLTGDLTADSGAGAGQSEERLREARYEFFRQTAKSEGARYLALAHTSDDQVETVVHRLIRGSGLRGLAGIPFTRKLTHGATLIRPLLRISRADVINYLAELGQEYREDPTNTNLHYTRNAIRHTLLPLLAAEFNSDVRAAVLRLSRQAQEAHETLAELAAAKLEACAEFREEADRETLVRLRRKALLSTPDYLLRLMFMHVWERCEWPQQAMGDLEWRRLAALATTADLGNTQAEMFPGGVRVEAGREYMTLSRSKTQH